MTPTDQPPAIQDMEERAIEAVAVAVFDMWRAGSSLTWPWGKAAPYEKEAYIKAAKAAITAYKAAIDEDAVTVEDLENLDKELAATACARISKAVHGDGMEANIQPPNTGKSDVGNPAHGKLKRLSKQKGIGGLVMEYGSIVCSGGLELIAEFDSLLSELSRLRESLQKIASGTYYRHEVGLSQTQTWIDYSGIRAIAEQALSTKEAE